MKTAIKDLLQKGLIVTAPYKKDMADWYSDVKIYNGSGFCSVIGDCFYKKFDDIDKAIDYFIEQCMSSKNLGYVLSRLARKGLLSPDTIEEHWHRKAAEFDTSFKEHFDKLVADEKKLIKQENKEDENEV